MNFMALFYQRCERGYEENKAVKIVDKIASVSFGFVPDCFISEMLVWNDKYNNNKPLQPETTLFTNIYTILCCSTINGLIRSPIIIMYAIRFY